MADCLHIATYSGSQCEGDCMKEYRFKATIHAAGGSGAYVLFPYDTQEEFSTRAKIPVMASFDGVPYTGSLVKYGHPQHMLPVLKNIREKIGKGPGDTGPGGKGEMFVFDVGADNKVSNGKLFSNFMVDGVKCGPDGVRCDVDGNLWCSSNAGRNVGYSGVTVWTPQGQLIGRIRLPEICGNVCFGGPKRNRLFMAASQSLYALYVQTQGAAPG